MIRLVLLLALSGLVAPANICNVDPRTGMFVATDLGRAVHHIFKVCTPPLKDLHVKADAKIITDIIAFGCTEGAACLAKVGEDMPKLFECLIEMVLANWTRIHEFDDHDIDLGVKTVRCSYPFISNAQVARHLILYLRKITG